MENQVLISSKKYKPITIEQEINFDDITEYLEIECIKHSSPLIAYDLVTYMQLYLRGITEELVLISYDVYADFEKNVLKFYGKYIIK